MALSQSLFSAISGLINHQTRLDNIGNNLANINTVGYKRNILSFQDILSQTIRGGMAPDGQRGGTNPLQIGLGMDVATIISDFTQGGLESTGRLTDLAIEGDGFFKVVAGNVVRYTRDGAFTLSQAGELVTANGFKVQGWMADQNGNIDTTAPTEALIISLGERRIAQETDNVYYTGNLNSSGAVSSTGVQLDSYQLYLNASGTTNANSSTSLASLYYNDGSGVQQLFPSLDVANPDVTVQYLKGGRTMSVTIPNAYAMNLGGFAAALEDALGIQNISGSGPDAAAGVSLAGGQLTINGNAGELSGISELEFVNAGVTTGIFSETTAADGESVVTSTVVYDSLGNEHMVTVTMALVSRDTTSSTWRWYADCGDDTDLDLAVGNGTVTFDTDGQITGESGDTFTVDLDLSGVSTQLIVDPDFALLTQFADALGSELNVRSQDGAPMGVLTSFTIAENGTITGLFTNGLTEDLGRLAVTRFANNNGLLRDAQNMFMEGVNSGLPQDGEALAGGRGGIRGGVLESSNVDIAKEFTDMIITQRGFQANARTITASDQMLLELINLTR